MSKLQTEKEILSAAYDAVKESLKAFMDVQMTYVKTFGRKADYQIEMRFSRNEKTIIKTYSVEIKKRTYSSTIGQLALLQKETQNKVVLITDHVPPIMAEKLRALDISFFDTNGNVYFNEPEYYIFVNTNRRNVEQEENNSRRIFESSGMQLLFVLLSNPNSENHPYRELAGMSGISLGSVSEVMSALQSNYYLVKEKNNRILFRKKELVDRWVQNYADRLLPKLRKLRFISPYDGWWQDADLSEFRACWGGEVAASLMTRNLRPSEFELYAKGTPIRLIKKHELKRAKDGDIKIVQKFWNFGENNSIAPPLLVYADLITSAKSRNIETAKIIYDQYIIGLIE